MMMTMNSRRKTNWDDEDEFFEPNRMSCAVPVNVDSSDSDDEDEDDFEDTRMSFASTARPSTDIRLSTASMAEYNLWMARPLSIKQRRMRLLEGMGLSADKEFLRLASVDLRKPDSPKSVSTAAPPPPPATPAVSAAAAAAAATSETVAAEAEKSSALPAKNDPLPSSLPLVSCSTIARVRSDGLAIASVAETDLKNRREEFLGPPPHISLARALSAPSSLCDSRAYSISSRSGADGSLLQDGESVYCTIKNLDTGKEFIIKESREDGVWNRLSDTETGRQLTIEEFEKCVGFSPIVKEVMRRVTVNGLTSLKVMPPSISKSIKSSKKKGGSWLKNIKGVTAIKGVTNSMPGVKGELEKKDRENSMDGAGRKSSSRRIKVHQHGKAFKELTGLFMCQEIQAHEGSIWTIRFSLDSRYLASAGEDRIIHVWEVIEIPGKDEGIMNLVRPADNGSTDQPLPPAARPPTDKKKKGKLSSAAKKSSSSTPDNIIVPNTVFSLSETPVCSFQGHLDDVLDLSWSKSQHLLSSSMDKTVRLWDMETKTCLKLFAHNDYVTCIQFNPIDERYFISGSLDAKVRIWSIPDRQVVDWSDLHEMVTAASYTPDGQGAVVGSHKGTCRWYNTSDCKLLQKDQVDIQTKKANAKKITGFQFAPENPSEVLVTSADSHIRVFDGLDLIHKFKGYKNTSSQIAASFTADGRYVVCASEDSQVYLWRRDEVFNVGASRRAKGMMTTRSHEHFQCRDVSVAIPWPCGISKYEMPQLPSESKKHNNDQLPQQPKSPNPTPASNDPTVVDDDPTSSNSSSSSSKKNQCPPLHKKSASDQTGPSQEEEQGGHSRSDSAASISSSSLSSTKSGILSTLSSSVASSMTSSWLWYDANSTGSQSATAWGLVVVTAGLGGEIKAYQNFGLPLRL